MKFAGVICDKCSIEVTRSTRIQVASAIGHIELASPSARVWFFKGLPGSFLRHVAP